MGTGGFGSLLRGSRLAAGLTQEELAERAALSVRAVSDLERGVSRPRPGTVFLLADALGLDEAGRAELAGLAQGSPGGEPRPAQGEPPPRQIPAAVANFTGRGKELKTLTALLASGEETHGTVVLSAIGG